MKKKALLKLADLLEKLPPNRKAKVKFDMGEWHCGTQACAIGVACDARIAPKGLKLIPTWAGRQEPFFYGYVRLFAVEVAYGINRIQAKHLFGVSYYPESKVTSPKYVAARIRKFVETNGRVE